MNSIKRKRKKKSLKLWVAEVVENHGGHVGVEKGISTRQMAKILKWPRLKVTGQMYPVKKYFRLMGKELLAHKAPKSDQIYFFAANTEERRTGIEMSLMRVAKTLRSLGQGITVLCHEDPQLDFKFGPERIEDGVMLTIESPSESKKKVDKEEEE
jgi:hypothetical protein